MEPERSPFFAINATTVEATLSEAVTEIDKADFEIEGLDVTNAAIKQTDSKVVVLTTAAQVGGEVYGLSYQGVDTGLTFTGISAVLPTAIKIADGTNFVTVGQEFTLSATVTTADANKAGIPVTFNIKSTASPALNQNIVVERYTDANGVAEYKYTRYATEDDAVSVYPTGAAAVRDTRTISWSAQPRLAITTTGTDIVANGATKTYTVTVLNQVTGKAVSGADVQVLFNENIGSVNGSTASATDVATGTTVVSPYQRATGDAKTLPLKTNSDGQATFSVTGSNTTATPIVYLDTVNARLSAQDIQLWAAKVTFQGAQTTSVITLTPETEATVAKSTTSGRVYTVDVKKADGTAFAGGVVQIAFNELIDNNIGTNTNAQFVWFDNDSTLQTEGTDGVVAGVKAAALGVSANFNTQLAINLNDKGQATFQIANNTTGQTATPIVWIDQDSTTSSTNNKLEAGEPFDLGGATISEDRTVKSAKLSVNSSSQAVGQVAEVTYKTLDQNGVAYIAPTDGNIRVTYTITNTGSRALSIVNVAGDNVPGNTWSINGATDRAFGAYTAAERSIDPGMSATVAATVVGQPTTIIGLTATEATSYSISAQGLTTLTNKSLPAAAITGTIVDAVSIDTLAGNGQSVTGTIIAFKTADMDYIGGVAAQSGRVLMTVDGQPGVTAWFTYTQGVGSTIAAPVDIGSSIGDNLFVGNDSTFNANTPATNAGFESALSVGNKVRFTQVGGNDHRQQMDKISLYNLNATNNNSQIDQTLPLLGAAFNTSVATDANNNGVVDTVTVSFKDLYNASLPVVDSSLATTDFTVDNATVIGVATGATANDDTVVLTVTPATAAYDTAYLGNVTITGDVTFANTVVVRAVDNVTQSVTDSVSPKLVTATKSAPTGATSTLTATGGNAITLTVVDPAYAGAYGNTVKYDVTNATNTGGTIAITYVGGVLGIELDNVNHTLSDVVAAINNAAATTGKIQATLPVTANGNDQVTVGQVIANVTFTGGSNVVTLAFSEPTTVTNTAFNSGVTFAVPAITAGSVTAGNTTASIEYTVTSAANILTNATTVTPVDAGIVDAAGNTGDPLFANVVTTN